MSGSPRDWRLRGVWIVMLAWLAFALPDMIAVADAPEPPDDVPSAGAREGGVHGPEDLDTGEEPAAPGESTAEEGKSKPAHPKGPADSGDQGKSAPSDKEEDAGLLGDPLAPGIVALLPDEIIRGLKRRQIEATFARFQDYCRQKLDSTAGPRTGSEVTGNCRLKWFDHMLRNVLRAPTEAEEFTRLLHKALLGDHRGLDQALTIAAEKIDLQKPAPRTIASPQSADEALETLEGALAAAQIRYAAALAPLTPAEIDRLARGLHASLTRNGNVGHTLSDRGSGRYMCDLLEKLDRDAMHSAAAALVPLLDPAFLKQLRALSTEGSVKTEGVTGRVVRRIETPAGDILIGGPEANTYQLDEMRGVNVVVDLGGKDTYYEGTCSLARPVFIVIDLSGDDVYRGKKPGIQGGAVLGVSLLVDAAGDDAYEAQDVAQGSCLGGVGILADLAGEDTYVGVRRIQGQAIGGLGILIDRQGNDRYHAAMWAQGFGGPLGFAVLDDMDGADHYFAGGAYYDSYEETPGYEGWSQGVGAGIRQVANGGIGVILDGGGDDIYEFDYISHGGGYWLGIGFARDFGGNDQRLGATRTAYNGSPRTEQRFQRFSNGFGCHYALGFLFDDAGDDTYNGTIMGVGFAWDVAVGVLCDFAGNDQYLATGGGTQGNGAQAGLGILYDYNGDDVYRGYGQGRASPSISYHDLPYCGGNFSFVVDYGGKDQYGCGASNNSYVQRSSSGGFLIDRPKQDETESEPEATAQRQKAVRIRGS
ncbi:MAG: hypothetical protein JW809_08400 [Pirellulales bacterium]|nr:hypothetical protein [Pirellulales bacterium]